MTNSLALRSHVAGFVAELISTQDEDGLPWAVPPRPGDARELGFVGHYQSWKVLLGCGMNDGRFGSVRAASERRT